MQVQAIDPKLQFLATTQPQGATGFAKDSVWNTKKATVKTWKTEPNPESIHGRGRGLNHPRWNNVFSFRWVLGSKRQWESINQRIISPRAHGAKGTASNKDHESIQRVSRRSSLYYMIYFMYRRRMTGRLLKQLHRSQSVGQEPHGSSQGPIHCERSFELTACSCIHAWFAAEQRAEPTLVWTLGSH